MTDDKKEITAALTEIAKDTYPMVDASKRTYTPDILCLAILCRRQLISAVAEIRREYPVVVSQVRNVTVVSRPEAGVTTRLGG